MSWSNWQGAIETTVKGLGYELVDAEKSAGGLLRVTIDHAIAPGSDAAGGGAGAAAPERAITVDDCEKVTRQLQHVLEVEAVAYQRLEVSSPGLDRPLKRESDYARFIGHEADLTLKLPFQGRKRWRGTLVAGEGGWRLVLPAEGDAAPRALDFKLDEVREARLVPVIDFKGRRARPEAADAAPVDAAPAPDGAETSARAPAGTKRPRAGAKDRSAARAAPPAGEVDGGRIR